MAVRLDLPLSPPASEMVQEEILKQVAFVSPEIREVRFDAAGGRFECEVPEARAQELREALTALLRKVQRSLRNLERKIVFRSSTMDAARADHAADAGVHFLGLGQVALDGPALWLFRYFDRSFESMGTLWRARPLLTPTLIPAEVLAKCDYFRSFPQNVTFACHLHEDVHVIDGFRSRHADRDTLEPDALASMDVPEACLSPAVCYHVYHLNRDRIVPAAGLAYGICGKCFRYESTNMRDLRRLWDFTMREVVLLGTREYVLQERERAIEVVSEWLERHQIAAEIRTASDPFFVAPDALAKTYFQLTSETKYEISALLPGGERLATGSLNYHSDFFGRAFNVGVESAGAMHSVCIAFGLERWVHAFLVQHGSDPEAWPDVMREAFTREEAQAR